jgi:hypothetical protein
MDVSGTLGDVEAVREVFAAGTSEIARRRK